MDTPQQPELHRSGRSAADPGAVKATAGTDRGDDGRDTGPVPAANRPGHRPHQEQDRPDLDAVAEALGTTAPESAGRAADGSRGGV